MSTRNLVRILGKEICILSRTPNYTRIDYGSRNGSSIVSVYDLFPGIQLFVNDFNTDSSFRAIERQDIIEINHCRYGRFECEFPSSKIMYMGEGDIAINDMSHLPISSSFPLKRFYGISVMIDRAVVRQDGIMKLFSIDFHRFYEELNLKDRCHVYRATGKVKQVLDDLYDALEQFEAGYIRFKVLELFYRLKDVKVEDCYEENYIPGEQVKRVKQIRNYMIAHPDERISLSELVSKYGISMTSFKQCFYRIYGDTPYSYIRTYRMNQAAQLLLEQDSNINEVALALSYKNSSKFSEAFQRVMGVTPREYRSRNRNATIRST